MTLVALLIGMLPFSASAEDTEGPGVEWILPQEHRLFLSGVPSDATIDRDWPMVTGIPEGDIEFDKTSSLIPTNLFDISSAPLSGPVGVTGNVTVELFASLSTQSDSCRLSNIMPGTPLSSTTTFYVTLTMGSYVIMDQEPTQTIVMDESYVAPHLFSVTSQNVNTSLGTGDIIRLEVSVVHECVQTGHLYWGTFDAHSGIIIQGDVLSPALEHTVDPNRIVRIEFDPSSPWGESDYSTQTVDVVGPYEDWADMVHSFYDEESRIDHFEDPHGSAVGDSNATLRTWSLSEPIEPGRYMIDICVQLSDRPYSDSCEAYAVLKFSVNPDSEPLLTSSVASFLIPIVMIGGILGTLRFSLLPTPVYGVLLLLALASSIPAHSLGPIDPDPIRNEDHPPSFTLLQHSGGSMSLDDALSGRDALVIGLFVPGSPNAVTQYNDFKLASSLADNDIAFIQIATSPDLLAIDVDSHSMLVNDSWPILLDTSTQSAGKSLPSGPSDAVIVLDNNGFVTNWAPRTMPSTEIIDSSSAVEKSLITNLLNMAGIAFSLTLLPIVLVALPRRKEVRDPIEGEFPGTGVAISWLLSSITFGLWFAPLCIMSALLGQSAWLPTSIVMGIAVVISGLRVSTKGRIGIFDEISERIYGKLPDNLEPWTSKQEVSDDLHLGLWIGIIFMISEPTMVVQGVLAPSNAFLVGSLASIFTFLLFSVIGGSMVVFIKLIVAVLGDIGRILGPMSVRIRTRVWGTGLTAMGIWWTIRELFLIINTAM